MRPPGSDPGSVFLEAVFQPLGARGPEEKAAGILLPAKAPLLGIPSVSCEQESKTALPRGSPIRGGAGGTG